MYRLREMDVDDKVCEQVSMTLLEAVYPKAVIERCVQQSAAGAAEYAAGAGVVGDRAGAVEPLQPLPGMAKVGGQAQRSASG
jgi:hypothetical protein